MLRFLITLCCAFSLVSATLAQETQSVPDGLYPVLYDGSSYRFDGPEDSPKAVLPFSSLFAEELDTLRWITILADDFVPLFLSKSPESSAATDDKLNLMLTLTEEAGAMLKHFSERYLDRRVAIVIDGEVVSMHGIREPITGGLLQISWCGENACRVLQSKLQDNVRDEE